MTEQKKEVIKRVPEQLNNEHGYVSSELLVRAARAKRHPLHDFFEWEDEDTAHYWRLEQAALMIRSVRFAIFLAAKKEPIRVEVRPWVSVPGNEGHYKERVVALKEEDIRADFIERKLAVLHSWCNETVDIEELQDLRTVVALGLVQYEEKNEVKEKPSELAALN